MNTHAPDKSYTTKVQNGSQLVNIHTPGKTYENGANLWKRSNLFFSAQSTSMVISGQMNSNTPGKTHITEVRKGSQLVNSKTPGKIGIIEEMGGNWWTHMHLMKLTLHF